MDWDGEGYDQTIMHAIAIHMRHALRRIMDRSAVRNSTRWPFSAWKYISRRPQVVGDLTLKRHGILKSTYSRIVPWDKNMNPFFEQNNVCAVRNASVLES